MSNPSLSSHPNLGPRTARRAALPAALITLTAWLLTSCGSVATTGGAGNSATTPILSTQSSTHDGAQNETSASRASFILRVAVTQDTTRQTLQREHPGSRVLALYPDQGYALLASSSRRSPRAILALESNQTVEAPVVAAGIATAGDGYTSWAGGYTSWAGGYTSWAGGTTTPTTFSENTTTWTQLGLLEAQRLVPELGQGVKVAVIDTGIDLKHPAFQNRLDLTGAYDYVGGDTTPQEENGSVTGYSAGYGHGTSVAGLILQVAPKATIVPFRVLKPDGTGDLDNVILAVNAAMKIGVKVINLSLGAYQDSSALDSVLATAVSRGIIVVTSSGNTSDTNVTYPARRAFDSTTQANAVPLSSGLLSVASVKMGDGGWWKSSFSTYGPYIKLSAPGEKLWGPFPNGLKSYFSGTSAAAPLVTGAVALALSTGVQTSAASMTEKILDSSKYIMDWYYGGSLGRGCLYIDNFIRNYRS